MQIVSKAIEKIVLAVCICAAVLSFVVDVHGDGGEGRISITQLDTVTKKAVPNIRLTLYKLADHTGGGLSGFQVTPPFEGLGISMDDLGEKNISDETVQKLDQFIETAEVEGIETKSTDQKGFIEFTNLADGIYFIKQTNSASDFENLDYSYETESYLVSLPRTGEGGEQIRKVVCQPKGILTESRKETGKILIYKLWKDSNDQYGKRPESILVGLYLNGELQEEIQLNPANNWRYEKEGLDEAGVWTVSEINVPEGYVSQVEQSGTEFTITNTYSPPGGTVTPTVTPGISTTVTPRITKPAQSVSRTKTSKPVKTGDDSNIFLYGGIGLVAVTLVIIQMHRRRKKNRK